MASFSSSSFSTSAFSESAFDFGGAPPPVVVTTPGGGSGYPVGPTVYWQGRSKYKRKRLPTVSEWVEDIYAELTAPEVSKEVQREAGKLLKPFSDTRAKVPQVRQIDFAKAAEESRTIQKLLDIWARELQEEAEQAESQRLAAIEAARIEQENMEIMMAVSEYRKARLLPILKLWAQWSEDLDD